MARRGGKDRGLFERPADSGVWWIHYHDTDGRKHREKVGPKGLARKLYAKRKTEVREARYFPPERRGKKAIEKCRKLLVATPSSDRSRGTENAERKKEGLRLGSELLRGTKYEEER